MTSFQHLLESTLLNFSKDKFPYDKWFINDADTVAYIYPNKYLSNGDLEAVYAMFTGQVNDDEEEVEIGVADIGSNAMKEWRVIPVASIPKEIVKAMMQEFKPLKAKDKDNE